MQFEVWLAFFMTAIVAAASPGPMVFLIVNKSINYGWMRANFIALGNLTTLIILSLLVVTGLNVVIQSSQVLFDTIRYFGAAYLIYIGVKQFKTKISIEPETTKAEIESRKSLYNNALLVGITNPKALIFIGSLFPQFIDQDQPIELQYVLLIGTLLSLSYFFLTTYSILAHST